MSAISCRRDVLHPAWASVQCYRCSGHGLVSSYSYAPFDFEGPEECPKCDGNGHIWLSPKGRYAKYPGGPFVGSRAKTRAAA